MSNKSLSLREGHIFGIFVDTIVRTIFRPKKNEAILGWREIKIEKLNHLWFLPDTVNATRSRRIVRQATHCKKHIGLRRFCCSLREQTTRNS
jgi:hypothetical protein